MKNTTIVALSLLAIGTPAWAKAQTYVGVDYAMATYEQDIEFATLDLKPTALRMRLGSTLNDYFAFELQGALGVSDDTQTIDILGEPVYAEFEVDSTLGVFLKGRAPIGERLGVFAMIGYSRVEGSYTVSAPTVDPDLVESGSESENDISMGFGADLRLTGRLYLNADYLQLIDKAGVEITSLNLGLRLDL